MYEEHPHVPLPVDRSTRIWRYLDFTKFLSLLDREALFFCHARHLDDHFEGSLTHRQGQEREELWSQLPEEEQRGVRQTWTGIGHLARDTVVVNCWHMNPHESAAMWRLYVTGNEGIAIQSTVDRLIRSFDRCQHSAQHVGGVQYIDYQGEAAIPFQGIFYRFFYKRMSFQHEQELRAISWTMADPLPDGSRRCTVDETPSGLYVPVDLDALIEAVYVSPAAPGWYRDLVQSVLQRYGRALPLHQSSLVDDPVY